MLVITLRTDDGVDAVLETSDGPIQIELSQIKPHDQAARIAIKLPDIVEVKRVVRASGEVVGGRGARSRNKLSIPQSSSPLSAGVAEATLAVTGQDAPATAGLVECESCGGGGRIEDADEFGKSLFRRCLDCGGVGVTAPKPLVVRGQGDHARATYGRDVLQQTAIGGLINAIV